MRASSITISALFMSSGLAAPAAMPAEAAVNAVAPVPTSVSLTGKKVDGSLVQEPAPSSPDSQGLQKRGAIIAVLGIAGTAAITKLTEMAIEVGADFIKDLGDWNDAREAFTKATTEDMWAKNPDYNKFPAAVCYNKGYRLETPANVDGFASVKFELGLLNTDYDCMYLQGPNSFWTDSEGGYINLSYTYNADRCSFDQATGDLTCS
ncbi:hypothetical protein S40288_01036 [Stachybotrys chartarum IBT 40288]|nr:hypothetical protein S40288_01036 [Stachybotrys chartarum IBT 40288]